MSDSRTDGHKWVAPVTSTSPALDAYNSATAYGQPHRLKNAVIELADALRDEYEARIKALEAELERLKVCGSCNHWWSGLMGCAMDSSQAVVCEGFDHCKVFTQLADKPETREPCWTDRKQEP